MEIKEKSDANRSNSGLSIKQNMLWNMFGSAIGLACQWAISILVVRLATDLSVAGLYSLAMSVYGIFSPIANFGLYTYLITDLEDRNTVGEYISLVCITSLFALCITTLYGMATCRPNAWPIIFAYAGYKSLVTIIDIIHAADQKAHRMDYIGFSLAAQGILCLISFTLVYSTTSSLILSIASMTACTLVIGIMYDMPKVKSLFSIKLGISRKKALLILGSCSLIVLSNIANGAFASVPRQTLSSLMGDEALGIYASVATPVAIVQVCSTYIYNPLIGYFAESYNKKDKSLFFKLINSAIFGILGIAVVSFIGSQLLAKPVLSLLYGNEVAAHSALMTPLIFSSVLLGAAGFLNSLLVAVRALKVMIASNLTSLSITLLFSSTLISTFGMNGATISLFMGCVGSILISSAGIAHKARIHFKS